MQQKTRSQSKLQTRFLFLDSFPTQKVKIERLTLCLHTYLCTHFLDNQNSQIIIGKLTYLIVEADSLAPLKPFSFSYRSSGKNH